MDPVLFCAVCVFMRFNASQQLTELCISITNFVRTIDFPNQTAMLQLSMVTFATLVLHLKLEALFLYLTN